MIKVLIIGLGSIGYRHYRILKKNKKIKDIKVISKRKLEFIKKIDFNKSSLLNYNPDYIIISTETSNHFSNLKKVNSILKNKIILVEKPLFHKSRKKIKLRNKVFVGFNMRFKPLLQFMKQKIKNDRDDNLLSAHVFCGSYLPDWRTNIHYTKSSSASKKSGGGVNNDLSHEVDNISWLFGDINTKFSILEKKSNLKISSDDTYILFGQLKNSKKSTVNISLNYYSKIPHRYYILDFEKKTIHADFINNNIFIKYLNGKTLKKSFKNFSRNFSYIKMHDAVINKSFQNLCSYSQGLKYIKK